MVHLLSPSRRGFSVRSILAFVLVVFLTTILATLFSSQMTHAVPGGDDSAWNGDSIVYDSHSFSLKQDFKDPTNTIPEGSTIYQSPSRDVDADSQKAFVLYFSPGVDPPKANKVQYVEFAVASDGTLSNPQNKKEISLTVKGEEGQLSSCSVDGVGWIICPLSVFIAGGMDQVFNILSGLIAVQPTKLGNPEDGMYIAWNIMRNIANIAFVIAFLIIIYSQLTSTGVSNYGLKKLIPRLIIAAILVNVSFIVTAVAIDISNILGYSIQNVFNDIKGDVFNLTEDNFSGLNDSPWTAVTSLVLAGGGVIGGTVFVANGGLWLLIPLLFGLILTLIFVVIVLAARQAIIVILVIIAPIAFVANLLPNTEKWFDKWKDLFFTMLIFFPAFSLVFGGSQLAGQIIIANAGDNIITVIFGLAVQIAPLVITPLILKFSGSLLGRIAQIANNPTKGVLDRSKNWANGRAEQTKQKMLSKNNPSKWNLGGNIARATDKSARNTKNRTELYKMRADNKYHETDEYGRIHEQMQGAEYDKKRIDDTHNAHIQSVVNTQGTSLNRKFMSSERAKTASELGNSETANMVSAYRAGAYNTGDINGENRDNRLEEIQRSMASNVIKTAAFKQAEQSNNYIQSRRFSEAMTNTDTNSTLLDIAQGAGSIEERTAGRTRAQSYAEANLVKLMKEANDNNVTLINSQALRSGFTAKTYSGMIAKSSISGSLDPELVKLGVNELSPALVEAAFEIQANQAQVNLLEDARASETLDQSLLDRVIARNEGTMKGKGGFHLQETPGLSLQRYMQRYSQDISAGNIDAAGVKRIFEKDLNRARVETLSNTVSENIGTMKYGAFMNTAKNFGDYIKTMDPNNLEDAQTLKKVHDSVQNALRDPGLRGKMTDRLVAVEAIDEYMSDQYFPDTPPVPRPEHEREMPNGDKKPATGGAIQELKDMGDIDPTAEHPSDHSDD